MSRRGRKDTSTRKKGAPRHGDTVTVGSRGRDGTKVLAEYTAKDHRGFQRTLDDTLTLLRQTMAERDEARKALAHTKTATPAYTGDIATTALHEQLTFYKASCEKLTQLFEAAIEQREKISAQLADSQQAQKALLRDLQHSQNKARRLQTELATLEATPPIKTSPTPKQLQKKLQITELENQLGKERQKSAGLEKQCEHLALASRELTAKQEALEGELAEIYTAHNQAVALADEATREAEKLHQENLALKEQLASVTAEHAEVFELADQASLKAVELNREKHVLTEQLADRDRRIAALEAQLASAQQTKSAASTGGTITPRSALPKGALPMVAMAAPRQAEPQSCLQKAWGCITYVLCCCPRRRRPTPRRYITVEQTGVVRVTKSLTGRQSSKKAEPTAGTASRIPMHKGSSLRHRRKGHETTDDSEPSPARSPSTT